MVHYKQCRKCLDNYPLEHFTKRLKCKDSYDHTCKTCLARRARERRKENPFKDKIKVLRRRAKLDDLPFNLTEQYLRSIWDGRCAISGDPIEFPKEYTAKYSNEAQIDKIEPSKGYIKGNVAWISFKWNRKKADSNIEDLELIIKFLRGKDGKEE